MPEPEANTPVDVMYSSNQIAARLRELAAEIAARKIERLLVIAVLKGSFVFAADLIRALHDEGSRLLTERLSGKIEVDHDTARRLFTLICALHWKG